MKTLAIIQLTFRESLAKRTFMAFFAISTLVNLLLLAALDLDIVNGMDAYISIMGQELDGNVHLADFVHRIESVIAVGLFTGGLFMSLFATSSLVPSFLDRGSIDLLLSKPLSRPQILLGRYLGAVAIVAFNIFYLVGVSWLILSLKTGIWNGGYLLSALMIVVTFAILFALMTLMGVLTRSGPFSLMITYLILFFSPLLIQRDQIYALLSNRFYGHLLDALYHGLPKTAELGAITEQLVRGAAVGSWTPLLTSLAFGLATLAAAGLLFQRKDF